MYCGKGEECLGRVNRGELYINGMGYGGIKKEKEGKGRMCSVWCFLRV